MRAHISGSRGSSKPPWSTEQVSISLEEWRWGGESEERREKRRGKRRREGKGKKKGRRKRGKGEEGKEEGKTVIGSRPNSHW